MESVPLFGEVIYTIEGEFVNVTNAQTLSEEEKSDEKLKSLLKDFELEAVFDHLKSSQVTYESLQYLKNEDLKEAVPTLGLRVQFRDKLFKWQKQTVSRKPTKINDFYGNFIRPHSTANTPKISGEVSKCTLLPL